MTQNSYKVLAAKRLAIDPNELLSYYENNGLVFATTPDGVQHTYTYEDLNRPKKVREPAGADGVRPPDTKEVAKTAQKGPGSPAAAGPEAKKPSKKVAK